MDFAVTARNVLALRRITYRLKTSALACVAKSRPLTTHDSPLAPGDNVAAVRHSIRRAPVPWRERSCAAALFLITHYAKCRAFN